MRLSEGESADALVYSITGLPPDILLSIFELLAEVDPPRYRSHDDADPRQVKTLGWIHVSHVNRQWRYLCLSTPDLWAFHVGALPVAVPIFLKRAGPDIPLRVRVEGRDPWVLKRSFYFLGVTDIIRRMRNVDWSFSGMDDLDRFYNRFGKAGPLPILRLLDLEYAEEDFDIVRLYEAPIDTPNAVSITYSRCFIPFAAPFLTRLNLMEIKMPCSYLLEVLAKVSMLELLNIRSCDFTGEISNHKVISLPRLQKLIARLRSAPEGDRTPAKLLQEFIEHLDFPPCAFLNVGYVGGGIGVPDCLDFIIPVVRSIWRETPPCGFEYLEGVNGVFSTTPLSPHCQSMDESFPNSLDENSEGSHVRAVVSTYFPERFAKALRGSLSVHGEFASLILFSAPIFYWDAKDWLTVLSSLPSLRTLHLRNTVTYASLRTLTTDDVPEDETKDVFAALCSAPDVLHVVSSTPPPGSDPSASQLAKVVVPSLDTLWISDAVKGARILGLHRLRPLMHLKNAMKRRAGMNARPLRTLKVDIMAEPCEGERSYGDAEVLRGLVMDPIQWMEST